jgi:site-specific recombinase XerD
MAKIHELIDDYLAYLEIEKNRSVKTRDNYGRYLALFADLTAVKKPEDITAETVRKFRLELARRKGPQGEMKKITQSYYVIALRNFLKYLAKRDIPSLSAEKIELPKIARRQIEILEYHEVERLLTTVKGEDLRSLRDRAILETFFSTGLRVSELCSLDRYLDLDRGEFTVRGKGEKLRVVFLRIAFQRMRSRNILRSGATRTLLCS